MPNVFLALAHRPDEFRAFFAYHDALMEKPGPLSNLSPHILEHGVESRIGSLAF